MSEAADRADAHDFSDYTNTTNDPVATLQNLISARLIVGKTSSFTEQEYLDRSNPQLFREIGRGCAGVVYERAGVDEVVKEARYDDMAANIRNDFVSGMRVWEQFAEMRYLFPEISMPWTPKYLDLIGLNDSPGKVWWAKNEHNFSSQIICQTLLTEQRVLPLPRPIREALIELYCPESGRQEAKKLRDCLCRLYLGRKRRLDAPKSFSAFTLRNFPVHLDQARTICPAEIDRFAREMGAALAVMHWACELDAHDVEFVLGSAPTLMSFGGVTSKIAEEIGPGRSISLEAHYDNDERRIVHIWVIDFDKVRPLPINGDWMERAIDAAEGNDPYYPKPVVDETSPDYHLWRTFGIAYVATSGVIIKKRELEGCEQFPEAFLQGWQAMRIKKLAMRTD